LLTNWNEVGKMRVLRLSLKIEAKRRRESMIICICRGKSDRDINRAIDNGASSLRDLQRCGIGDQCGSCHNALKGMLARAAAAASAPQAPQPCPACAPSDAVAI